MIFNIFKHKKDDSSKTFDGRIITDDEIKNMSQNQQGETFIKKEMNEIYELLRQVNKMRYGRE